MVGGRIKSNYLQKILGRVPGKTRCSGRIITVLELRRAEYLAPGLTADEWQGWDTNATCWNTSCPEQLREVQGVQGAQRRALSFECLEDHESYLEELVSHHPCHPMHLSGHVNLQGIPRNHQNASSARTGAWPIFVHAYKFHARNGS